MKVFVLLRRQACVFCIFIIAFCNAGCTPDPNAPAAATPVLVGFKNLTRPALTEKQYTTTVRSFIFEVKHYFTHSLVVLRDNDTLNVINKSGNPGPGAINNVHVYESDPNSGDSGKIISKLHFVIDPQTFQGPPNFNVTYRIFEHTQAPVHKGKAGEYSQPLTLSVRRGLPVWYGNQQFWPSAYDTHTNNNPTSANSGGYGSNCDQIILCLSMPNGDVRNFPSGTCDMNTAIQRANQQYPTAIINGNTKCP